MCCSSYRIGYFGRRVKICPECMRRGRIQGLAHGETGLVGVCLLCGLLVLNRPLKPVIFRTSLHAIEDARPGGTRAGAGDRTSRSPRKIENGPGE
jgi:hypothetical protein